MNNEWKTINNEQGIMNNEEQRAKSGSKGITLLFAICYLLFVSGCSGIFLEKPREHQGQETGSPGVPDGFGTVEVSLSGRTARTVMPDPVGLDRLSLEYWFAGNGGAPEKKEPSEGKFILETGTYTLTVKGFLTANDPESLAAQGEKSFTLTAGTAAETVNVTLRPVVTGEGTGSLEFGLRYPSGVTVETLTLTRIAGEESPIDLLDPVPGTSGTDPVTLSGTKNNIPVGYYLLRAVLKNGSTTEIGKTEVVHIYQNLTAKTTLAGYTFTNGDFEAYLVTNTGDTGAGSLRQALADVPAGGTVRVLLAPGSVIELESSLTLSTAKTIAIEGNGVTLTRKASWTATSATSQLLYINSATANVTISRVHFKDGRATNYGGAIRTTGILTLDSCIFSGNTTTSTSSSYGGGAIYNSGNPLTIRGCTFYGNTSRQGGAVYFRSSGNTLTLTGNLFYGNTSPYRYPVVYVYEGTANASSNVVDLPFGTANTDMCGWAAGTGDTTFDALSITGTPFDTTSFAPVSGLRTFLTSSPADFPAKDFNGAARTFPGAPGAVR